MLDFSELSPDGQDLELLVRELLLNEGLAAHWSGKGPDGGRDLICIESQNSFFQPSEKRWLVQCKHYAGSGRAVGVNDLDNIADTCLHHGCTGYVLACSTYPSSTVVQRLEAITANSTPNLVATYLDAVRIEQLLSTPSNWALAQRFFPASASGWRVYATDRPNQWVVIYKGYYFQLFNRIGSHNEFHLASIEKRVEDIEHVSLPTDHHLRIRGVYYDDKNGGYTWYLDYMHPHDQDPAMSARTIEHKLGDGYALDDGQSYTFEVRRRAFFKYSDHHDLDHYDYYDHAALFSHGLSRPGRRSAMEEAVRSDEVLRQAIEKERNSAYDAVVTMLTKLPFLRVLRSCNAEVEYLDRFCSLLSWAALIEELHLETDRFFSAWFLLETTDDGKFHDLMSFIPQGVPQYFRLSRSCIYVPSDVGSGSRRDDEHDESLYELTFHIHPAEIADKTTGRARLNRYFEEVVRAIEKYIEQNP